MERDRNTVIPAVGAGHRSVGRFGPLWCSGGAPGACGGPIPPCPFLGDRLLPLPRLAEHSSAGALSRAESLLEDRLLALPRLADQSSAGALSRAGSLLAGRLHPRPPMRWG